MLELELGNEVVDEVIVEVLAIEVHFSSSDLDFKYPFLNDKEGDVEGATAEIEGEDIVFLAMASLLVEAGDRDQDLASLALGVVKVGQDGDNNILRVAKEGFGDLAHLGEKHGDLLEALLLALVGEEDKGLVASKE